MTRTATARRRRSRRGGTVTRCCSSLSGCATEGSLTDEDVAAMEQEIAAEIDDAVAFAEASDIEPVEDLTRFVAAPRACGRDGDRDDLPRGSPRGHARGDEARRPGLPHGGGRRRVRRRVRRQPGPARGVRAGAHQGHPAVGVRLRRCRHRRRARWHAPDRRDHDGQLLAARARPDRQHRGVPAAHERRAVQHPARDPDDDRSRSAAGRSALALAGELVRPRAGSGGPGAGDGRGRPRHALARARAP